MSILSARKRNILPTIPKILIVCEGARTEPYYFKKFRIPPQRIVIEGKGMNTDSLVEYAIERKVSETGEPFDQVWQSNKLDFI